MKTVQPAAAKHIHVATLSNCPRLVNDIEVDIGATYRVLYGMYRGRVGFTLVCWSSNNTDGSSAYFSKKIDSFNELARDTTAGWVTASQMHHKKQED